MEDAQPNEVRLSRKGSTIIPRVRTTRPVHTPYRSQSSPHRPPSRDPRPSKRIRRQPSPTRAPLPSLQISRTEKALEQELVEFHLPRECHIGAPGSHNARKRWIEDQKHYLRTNRHLSVLSFKYLDRDRRVLFTCRTRQATQSTEHDTRDGIETGSHLVNAYLETESIGTTRQGAIAPSVVKARDNHTSDIVQSSEPGRSRIRLTTRALAGVGGCPQRLDNHSSIPSFGYSVERKLVESSMTEMKSCPVQAVHTNPVPRHRAAIHSAPPTESIIDLTLDPPGPVAEENSARWSTFRSGYVDIYLPPLNSASRISSSEASTDPRPSIDQTPGQVVGQPEDMPVVRNSDTNPHPAQPNILVAGTFSVRSMEDHRIAGHLSDQHHQHNVLEANRSGYSRDCSMVLEDEAKVLPSPPDHSSLVRGLTLACGNLPLSLGPRDRPRRILHDDDFACVVTAHGIVDQVGTTSALKLDRNIRSPSLPSEEFVDDACILSHQGEPVIILGHMREQNQTTFLYSGHGQVSRHTTPRRDWNAAKRPGVSAMAPLMSPLKFVSGGYDHRVHLWDIAQDLSGASAVELAIKHTSLVHSLLPIVDTSHKLVSVGADRDIPIYDMSAERVVQTLKMSCTPYHAHKIDTLSCTLFEVSHLEMQFEARDHRIPDRAVQRFGFITQKRRGRFDKADTRSHFVVCGDRNGAVRLWDLRNVSTEVALRQCFDDPVIQVVHTGPRLLACSKRNELACINFQGE